MAIVARKEKMTDIEKYNSQEEKNDYNKKTEWKFSYA